MTSFELTTVNLSDNDDLEEIQSMIEDEQLHRRNPRIVREELQFYEDLINETNFTDLEFDEMPGLQNPEQWKRIASRDGHASLPQAAQYHQSSNATIESIEEQFASMTRSNANDPPSNSMGVKKSGQTFFSFQTTRARMSFTFVLTSVIILVTLAIVLVVMLVKQSGSSYPAITSNYYKASILVRGHYSSTLADVSSSLAKMYERQLCTLVSQLVFPHVPSSESLIKSERLRNKISTTFSDAQTRYASYFSTCSIDHFRNGTIFSGFTLGFTTRQNISRLSQFLNRSLASQSLFGGKILWVQLDLSIAMNDSDDNTKQRILPVSTWNISNDSQTQTMHTTIDQVLSSLEDVSSLSRQSRMNSLSSNRFTDDSYASDVHRQKRHEQPIFPRPPPPPPPQRSTSLDTLVEFPSPVKIKSSRTSEKVFHHHHIHVLPYTSTRKQVEHHRNSRRVLFRERFEELPKASFNVIPRPQRSSSIGQRSRKNKFLDLFRFIL